MISIESVKSRMKEATAQLHDYARQFRQYDGAKAADAAASEFGQGLGREVEAKETELIDRLQRLLEDAKGLNKAIGRKAENLATLKERRRKLNDESNQEAMEEPIRVQEAQVTTLTDLRGELLELVGRCVTTMRGSGGSSIWGERPDDGIDPSPPPSNPVLPGGGGPAPAEAADSLLEIEPRRPAGS